MQKGPTEKENNINIKPRFMYWLALKDGE